MNLNILLNKKNHMKIFFLAIVLAIYGCDKPIEMIESEEMLEKITLSEDQIKLLADALWMRQRCFIAGDRRFKEYGAMLDTLLEDMEYTPSRF